MKKILLVTVCTILVLFCRSQIIVNETNKESALGQEETRPKLIYFVGDINEDRILLKWNVAENESVNLFEIKKSYDGKNFSTSGFIMASEKKGNETYFFPEILPQEQRIYYRLKIIGINKKVKFSSIISLQPSLVGKTSVATIGNELVNQSMTK